MDYDFQSSYTLLPQSPLLHFQHDNAGATLRASEVKPKLDRYLIRLAEAKGNPIPEDCFNPKHPDSLDYKLGFEALEPGESITVGQNENRMKKASYEMYYGNTGLDEERHIRGIMCKTRMTVTCFHPELMSRIKNNLPVFFFVTNFGRMQSKGFGSFVVERRAITRPGEVAAALKTEYGCAKCYRFAIPGRPENRELFTCIKTVYSIMKAGIKYPITVPSLLESYMKSRCKPGLGNEKEWMYDEGLAPRRKKASFQKSPVLPMKKRYVRAVLGVGDHIDFMNVKTKVSIANRSGEIERFPSPVFFKVVDGVVYFVGTKIDKRIFGQEFLFQSNNGRKGVLSVPREDELPADFMDSFMEYCCTELNKGVLRSPAFKKQPALFNLRIEEVK